VNFRDPVHNLLHLYEDGALTRRDLVSRLTKYTGSLAASAAVIQEAGLAQATAQACPAGVQVAENDPAVINQLLTVHGEAGPLYVYQSLPADYASARRPAVLVVHENRGLTDHIKDVTRRVAKVGFVAVGVDLLSREGGSHTITDPVQQSAAFGRTTPQTRLQDMASALMTIRDQPYVQGDRLGAVGFCAGGGDVFNLATSTNLLNAAVVFYGTVPQPEQLANMQAALLGHFAELDTNINGRLPVLMTALNAGRKRHELHVHWNTGHAFHNDTGPRYDAEAACDAWSKTIRFFNRLLNAA
jgi:carboxymethylenebutenolidase